MKRNIYIITYLVLFYVFFIAGQAFGARVYDDFSGTYIDGQKWNCREVVREVDTVAGKLISKIGNPGSGHYRNGTSFQSPAYINAIECKLTVVTTNLDTGTDPISFARVGGFFYNTQVSGEATGDILAVVYIGDRGSGLEAFCGVYESLDDNLNNFQEKGSGTLIGSGILTHGTTYTTKIQYDGNNGFDFTVDGQSDSFTGPARQRAAVTLSKGLATGAYSDGGSGIGYVSALFDDVYINNEITVYDDFSTAPLDLTKWQRKEVVREISGGKLRMNVQAKDSTNTVGAPLKDYSAYLETKVTVENSSSVSLGAKGAARVGGYYYNDSRGPGSGQLYNGYEGNVWGDIRIELYDNGNLKAIAFVSRSNDADGSTRTCLLYQEFSTPISFDTTFTLSIEFTGSTFIFKCNAERINYSVITSTYEPYNKCLYLTSRVFADPGESGYMKTKFDDVCLTKPFNIAPASLLLLNN
jgi:hypothetical protein